MGKISYPFVSLFFFNLKFINITNRKRVLRLKLAKFKLYTYTDENKMTLFLGNHLRLKPTREYDRFIYIKMRKKTIVYICF